MVTPPKDEVYLHPYIFLFSFYMDNLVVVGIITYGVNYLRLWSESIGRFLKRPKTTKEMECN
jgi:hypothetical protein